MFIVREDIYLVVRLVRVGVGVRLRLTVVVARSLGGGVVLLLQTSVIARS